MGGASRRLAVRLLSDYGILLALLALCGWFSWVTVAEQRPAGEPGGRQAADRAARTLPPGGVAMVAAGSSPEDAAFAASAERELKRRGYAVAATAIGTPADARDALDRLSRSGRLDAIVCSETAAAWAVFDSFGARFPRLAGARIVVPRSYRYPNFLKAENLLNVANQIAVIAIIAIGMTMVIITGGIDLSVGSLIALSAVTTTLLIRARFGAESAGVIPMIAAAAAGIALCGAVGIFSGAMITWFRVPPFIVTLGMMLVASGMAFILAQGQSIYQVPDSFVWLGRGADLFGLPNAVLLTLALYAGAHLFMSRTRPGRYIYAVGANPEAARLSAVPVRRILLFVYAASGLLAGLGGVVMASQLKSGAPTYGGMYELYVIAAVVVGGTSLSGGQGTVFGTLLGALLIAVIQNGMNLTGIEPYTQKVVLGLVILGAVLLDRLKQRLPAATD